MANSTIVNPSEYDLSCGIIGRLDYVEMAAHYAHRIAQNGAPLWRIQEELNTLRYQLDRAQAVLSYYHKPA